MRKILTKLYVRWNEPKWMLYFFKPSLAVLMYEYSMKAFEGKTMYEVVMESMEKEIEEE